ncbi:hypothetical protein RP20_CCG023067 [Aedes albopictus]|nr:hypothetical protein RP20_CCG023067 [Aedes albopictus]
MTGIKAHLRSKIWFPEMDKLVEKVVKACKPCQMTALPDKPNPIGRRIPTQPWEDLAMDFKEGLPDGKSLFVVVCYTSRFIQVEVMKPATSQKVISALLKMFASLGVPRSITADNGPQFRSEELKQFCVSYGVHLNLTTPYWPEQNGAVERQMRNIGRRIKISVIQGTNWEADLLDYLIMYHSTPQETTGVSPARMLFGREMRNSLPSLHKSDTLLFESSKDRDMVMKEQHKAHSDSRRHATFHGLQPGDVVIMRNLKLGSLQPTFGDEEFDVVDVKGGEVVVRSNETGKTYTRNSTHLKFLRKKEELCVDNNKELSEVGGSATDSRVCEAEEVRDTRQRREIRRPKKFEDFV